ncbi:tyrosine-type recombinase/integrase [Pseudonocardia tropica]|uniref:Tyrosine-type recombinase/integrase n=1 Tax=Pseudonocardia tropica TaxID=681289 RepID=A0ABV1K1N1_9PSEU
MTRAGGAEIAWRPGDDEPAAVAAWHPPRRETIAGAWLLSVRSPRTRAAYRVDLRQYFSWADRFGIDALAPARFHADGYREWLAHTAATPRGTRYAEATVARKLTAVSSFLRYASTHFARDVAANPFTHVARPELDDDSTTVGLSLDEAGELLTAATRMGPRERALIEVFLGTALRVSELAGAAVTDLGAERGTTTLRVRLKRGRIKRIALPDEAAAALADYLGDRRAGPLFQYRAAWPTRQVLAHALDRIARTAGLGAKGISPHSLRHTAATIALDEGRDLRDVQDMLGHKDPRTSRRYDRARDRLDRAAGRTVSAALHRPRPEPDTATGAAVPLHPAATQEAPRPEAYGPNGRGPSIGPQG